jgi:hypothetical protein
MPTAGEVPIDDQMAIDTLAYQTHFEDIRDTSRFAKMLLLSLDDERARWTAARFRHDHAAAAESALEQQVLVQLAGACVDHLRMIAAGSVLH